MEPPRMYPDAESPSGSTAAIEKRSPNPTDEDSQSQDNETVDTRHFLLQALQEFIARLPEGFEITIDQHKLMEKPRESVHPLDCLIPALLPIHMLAGTDVVVQGEVDDNLYILESGKLRVSVFGNEVSTMARGAVFGDLAMLFGTPRSATVTCIEDCDLWLLDRKSFFTSLGMKDGRDTVVRRTRLFSQLKEISGLPLDRLQKLISGLRAQVLTQGERLYIQGRCTTKAMLVEEGSVAVEIPPRYVHLSDLDLCEKFGIHLPDRSLLETPTNTGTKPTSKGAEADDDGGDEEDGEEKHTTEAGEKNKVEDSDDNSTVCSRVTINGKKHICVGKGAILGTGVLPSKMMAPDAWPWKDEIIDGVPSVGAVSPATIFAHSDRVRITYFTSHEYEILFGPASAFYFFPNRDMMKFANAIYQPKFIPGLVHVQRKPAWKLRSAIQVALQFRYVGKKSLLKSVVSRAKKLNVSPASVSAEPSASALPHQTALDFNSDEEDANSLSGAAKAAAMKLKNGSARSNSLRQTLSRHNSLSRKIDISPSTRVRAGSMSSSSNRPKSATSALRSAVATASIVNSGLQKRPQSAAVAGSTHHANHAGSQSEKTRQRPRSATSASHAAQRTSPDPRAARPASRSSRADSRSTSASRRLTSASLSSETRGRGQDVDHTPSHDHHHRTSSKSRPSSAGSRPRSASNDRSRSRTPPAARSDHRMHSRPSSATRSRSFTSSPIPEDGSSSSNAAAASKVSSSRPSSAKKTTSSNNAAPVQLPKAVSGTSASASILQTLFPSVGERWQGNTSGGDGKIDTSGDVNEGMETLSLLERRKPSNAIITAVATGIESAVVMTNAGGGGGVIRTINEEFPTKEDPRNAATTAVAAHGLPSLSPSSHRDDRRRSVNWDLSVLDNATGSKITSAATNTNDTSNVTSKEEAILVPSTSTCDSHFLSPAQVGTRTDMAEGAVASVTAAERGTSLLRDGSSPTRRRNLGVTKLSSIHITPTMSEDLLHTLKHRALSTPNLATYNEEGSSGLEGEQGEGQQMIVTDAVPPMLTPATRSKSMGSTPSSVLPPIHPSEGFMASQSAISSPNSSITPSHRKSKIWGSSSVTNSPIGSPQRASSPLSPALSARSKSPSNQVNSPSRQTGCLSSIPRRGWDTVVRTPSPLVPVINPRSAGTRRSDATLKDALSVLPIRGGPEWEAISQAAAVAAREHAAERRRLSNASTSSNSFRRFPVAVAGNGNKPHRTRARSAATMEPIGPDLSYDLESGYTEFAFGRHERAQQQAISRGVAEDVAADAIGLELLF